MEEIDGSEVHRFKTNGVNLTRETLEKMVSDALFNELKGKTSNIQMTTGKGGVYEMIRAVNRQFNVPNPDNVTRAQIRAVFRWGWVKRIPGTKAYLIQ